MTQSAVPSAISYEDVQEGNDLYTRGVLHKRGHRYGFAVQDEAVDCSPRD